MAGGKIVDWEKYDPMIRAGVTPSKIADEAGCAIGTIYGRRSITGVDTRQYKKTTTCSSPGYTSEGVFDYWGWLKGECKRLGRAEVIRQYGHQ